ncbi:hypothetical protein R69776_04660 [Paraburkholderia nemoris]|uniref:HTH cro/C1-type domain-containing protein n=2 Tax=Burkholderiaceae TaxID=119060 RepID=A0ABM8S4N3_9BURK|nr:hypothetical protein R20943_03152 [Paraburkholderia aspalathi]CAE6788886.1 hypothetical protein R69776_04660 [Paraburkholderia nemoris]
MSQLERGRQTPTLEKLDAIATAIGIHPLSLVIYAYSCGQTDSETAEVQKRVGDELARLRMYDSEVS